MTTKKLFPKFFSKAPDSKKSTQGEAPCTTKEKFKDSEFEEFSSTYKTQKLHRSRSGRLKESSRLRLALTKDTFETPSVQSAPVASMTKPAGGLGGRDLPMFEGKRVNLSLQSHINSASLDDKPPPPRNPSGEEYGLDENEVF